ncbi:hypothetical protein TNCV_1040721 [Trichonephila clavipes]|nr:hypothetical protein TNCV_1040721 [Trichonephila clavipes]
MSLDSDYSTPKEDRKYGVRLMKLWILQTSHPTVPTNLTELLTASANTWQVIPVERFQELVESMPRHVAAVIKARGQLVTR